MFLSLSAAQLYKYSGSCHSCCPCESQKLARPNRYYSKCIEIKANGKTLSHSHTQIHCHPLIFLTLEREHILCNFVFKSVFEKHLHQHFYGIFHCIQFRSSTKANLLIFRDSKYEMMILRQHCRRPRPTPPLFIQMMVSNQIFLTLRLNWWALIIYIRMITFNVPISKSKSGLNITRRRDVGVCAQTNDNAWVME